MVAQTLLPFKIGKTSEDLTPHGGLDVARGGTAAVHLVLNDLSEGGTMGLSVRDGRGAAARSAQWFRLVDVPVERNTGREGFTEKEGERNEFVIRRAPFRVYDAMEPVSSTVRCGGATMGLRLEVPVRRDARPGRRWYVVGVEHKGERRDLRLGVRVHGVAIPPTGRESWPYTNWFSLKMMAERWGATAWSRRHWRMIRAHAELMARGRQNTFLVEWSDIFREGAKGLVLNRQRLRRIVKTFTGAGLYYIEGGHVASRTGGEWKAPTFDVNLVSGGVRATSPEGNAVLAGALRQLVEEIGRNGWRDRWIQHVTDEPTADNAADYRILAGMVRRHMPGLRLVDATMDPELVGSVDIWCPQPQEYERHREGFEAQRAIGDGVWFYTCCVPGGPYLNRLLDMELLRPALLGWGAMLYDLDGFLHWGLNQYPSPENPFEKSIIDRGGDTCLPAGDTHVVYPGKDGPWSSLRFEAQREGLEHLELLRALQKRDPQRARGIVRKVIRGFSRYTKDTVVFRKARRELLEAL